MSAALAVTLPIPVHSGSHRPQRPGKDQVVQTASTAPPRSHPRGALAFRAADPGATISDFKFAPATITVHAGESVTWINHGPSTHTATARDGSFDSGPLKPGASSSHTFTRPGTYQYFCTIHPFMHGTVVVLASAAAAPPPPSKHSTTTTGPSSTQATRATRPPRQTPGRPRARRSP